MYPCSHDKCIDEFVVVSLILVIFGYKGSEVCIQCNKDDLSKAEAQKKMFNMHITSRAKFKG